MSAFIAPRYDNGIMSVLLGELFGIDPRKLTDYSAKGYGGNPEVTVTIEAKMHISYDQYNAMLRAAQIP